MSEWYPYSGPCAGGPMNGQNAAKLSNKFGVLFKRDDNHIPELDYYIWNEVARMFIWNGPNNFLPIKKED